MLDHTGLVQTERLIIDLEARRSRLLEEVRQVEKELLDAQATRARLMNTAAPLYKLPDELLAEVFQICYDNPLQRSKKRSNKPFEVTVSHVSSRWRHLILNLPLLWSTISLKIYEEKKAYLLQRISNYLIRSSQCLLDIYLDIALPSVVSDILRGIAVHASRWHRVYIVLERGFTESLCTAFRSIEAPQLIHLSLRVGKARDEESSPRTEYPATSTEIISRGCPSLVFLRVAGKMVGNLMPPVSTVTTLHVDAWPKNLMSFAQFRSTLASLPHLVNLSLAGLSIQLPRNPMDSSEPIFLSSLRSLRIRGNSTPGHRLLSLLSLPNLESLVLCGVDTFNSIVIPTLHSLTLESCPLSWEELWLISRVFPAVSTFEIDEGLPEMYDLINTWPHLKSVCVRDLNPADAGGFSRILLSRADNTNAPLLSVQLDRRSKAVLKNKTLLVELSKHILIKDVESPRWPSDLCYEDPDDGWYI